MIADVMLKIQQKFSRIDRCEMHAYQQSVVATCVWDTHMCTFTFTWYWQATKEAFVFIETHMWHILPVLTIFNDTLYDCATAAADIHVVPMLRGW